VYWKYLIQGDAIECGDFQISIVLNVSHKKLWNVSSIVSFTVRSIRFKLPDVLDNRDMKVIRLSALPTGHLYSLGGIPGTHGHSTAGRIKSMKNPNSHIGN
jgi:hypothetical protein